MAGGAGTYTVSDSGYASIAAALAQLMADEDGTPFAAAQEIVLEKDSTESAAIVKPTTAEAFAIAKYPLIIRGDAQSPRRKWARNASAAIWLTHPASPSGPVKFQDIEFWNASTSGSAATFLTTSGGLAQDEYLRCKWEDAGLLRFNTIISGANFYHAVFKDCLFARINTFRSGSSTTAGDLLFENSRVRILSTLAFNGGGVARIRVKAINSAFLLNGPMLDTTFSEATNALDLRHCTLYFGTAAHLVSTASTLAVLPSIKNCILHNCKGLRTEGTAGAYDIQIEPYDQAAYNIWSAIAAGNFLEFNTSANDIATLAAAQARGLEVGSVSHAGLTFASTDPADDTFLRVSGLTNFSKNCGVHTDYIGTDRSAIFVAPGHWQETARTLDLTTTAGGGNSAVPAAGSVLVGVPTGTTVGTFDKDAYAEAFEAARNSGASSGIIKLGETVKQLNVDIVGTYDPSGTPCAAPTLTLTAGNGSIVCALTPATGCEAIPMYLRYWLAPDGAYSAESESLKRTGAGNVTIPSLTNGSVYGVIAYHKDGTKLGYASLAAYAAPDDGTNEATGIVAGPLGTLRDMLADCAAWQTLCSAGSAEEAKTHIYLEAVPSANAHANATTYTGEIASARPFLILCQGESWNSTRIGVGAQEQFSLSGTIILQCEFAVPTALSDDTELDGALVWFHRTVGGILSDLREQSGQSGNLYLGSITLKEGPYRADDKTRAEQGDFVLVSYEIQWGLAA